MRQLAKDSSYDLYILRKEHKKLNFQKKVTIKKVGIFLQQIYNMLTNQFMGDFFFFRFVTNLLHKQEKKNQIKREFSQLFPMGCIKYINKKTVLTKFASSSDIISDKS